MRDTLNIGKLKTLAAALVATVVLTACFQDPMSAHPGPKAGTEDVQLQLNMAVSGVNKLAKGNAITLSKLIVVLTSNATPADTIRDTIHAGMGGLSTVATSEQTVSRNYGLKALRTWKIVATVRDTRDSVIHRDSATTPTLYAADTAAVSLNLSSRFAMYEAKFLSIPDSINSASGTVKQKLNLNRLVLKIDGVVVRDSSATPGPYFTSLATHSLSYDYVSTGTKAALSSGTSQHLNAVTFASRDTVFAVGNGGKALRSVNGGATWQQMAGFPVTGKTLRSVFFRSPTTGWILGDSAVYRTTNGGASWTAQSGTINSSNLRGITFVGADTGFVVGGSVYRSTDGGASWGPAFGFGTVHGISFAPQTRTGWLVGTYSGGVNIRKTTNGGDNWSNQTGSTGTLRAVKALAENIAVAAGDGGVILRTTDGATWTTRTSGTTQNLLSLHFVDVATGFAVGENGVILSTNDTGATWTVESTPGTAHFNGVSFFGGNGVIVGNGGAMYSISGPRLVEMLAYGPMGNWDSSSPLFAGSKYVHASPGSDVTIALTLNWVGPTGGVGAISATLGKVGKVTIIGNLPGTIFP